LVAARLLGPNSFGHVVIAMSAVFLAVAAQRAVVGEPALAHVPVLTPLAGRRVERDALAAAAGIGIAAGLLCLVVSLAPTTLVRDLHWAALWLPTIVVQDGVRYVAFSRRRPDLAAASDAAWGIGQGAALLVLVLAGKAWSPSRLITAWGVGALLGAAVGMWLLGVTPRHGRPGRWVKLSRSLSVWLLPQTTLSQGSAQVSILLVGALLGAEAVGGFRALQTLVMPMGAVITVAIALLVPLLATVMQTAGPRGQTRLVRSLTVQAGLLAAIVAVLLAAWSTTVTRLVFGSSYVRFHNLVLPLALSMVVQAVGLPVGAGLRALGEGRRVFLAQLVTSAVGLPALLLLSLTLGLGGAAWSLPLQTAVMTATAGALYRLAVRDRLRRKEGVGAPVNSHSVA